MLDEKVKQKDTGYFDIYTDLKQRIKNQNQMLPYGATALCYGLFWEDVEYYIPSLVSTNENRINNTYRLPTGWSVPRDPYDALYPYDCLGGKKLREISFYESQEPKNAFSVLPTFKI